MFYLFRGKAKIDLKQSKIFTNEVSIIVEEKKSAYKRDKETQV